MAGVVTGTGEVPIFYIYYVYIQRMCWHVAIISLLITVLSWKMNSDICYYRVCHMYIISFTTYEGCGVYDAPRGGECREALPN